MLQLRTLCIKHTCFAGTDCRVDRMLQMEARTPLGTKHCSSKSAMRQSCWSRCELLQHLLHQQPLAGRLGRSAADVAAACSNRGVGQGITMLIQQLLAVF
jgi:hypothetical protein